MGEEETGGQEATGMAEVEKGQEGRTSGTIRETEGEVTARETKEPGTSGSSEEPRTSPARTEDKVSRRALTEDVPIPEAPKTGGEKSGEEDEGNHQHDSPPMHQNCPA